MKRRVRALSALCLCFASAVAHASITREDVLECGLPDGSKFVLRSKYEWATIPWPVPHHSRASKRGSWGVQYRGISGEVSSAPASVHFSGTYPEELREVCAYFGMRDGVPLVAHSYLQPSGNWLPISENFPWDKLDVHFPSEPMTEAKRAALENLRASLPPEEARKSKYAALDAAGVRGSTYLFAFILPKHGRLGYEQPLHRADAGYLFDKTFDAVYQSFSDDWGKTWSDPVIATKAEIFEIGKSSIDQCFRARPIKIDGKRIAADFTPCSSKPPGAGAPTPQHKPEGATGKP